MWLLAGQTSLISPSCYTSLSSCLFFLLSILLSSSLAVWVSVCPTGRMLVLIFLTCDEESMSVIDREACWKHAEVLSLSATLRRQTELDLWRRRITKGGSEYYFLHAWHFSLTFIPPSIFLQSIFLPMRYPSVSHFVTVTRLSGLVDEDPTSHTLFPRSISESFRPVYQWTWKLENRSLYDSLIWSA